MGVYTNLSGIVNLSDSSLSSTVSSSNQNFNKIRDSLLEFLSAIQFDESGNSIGVSDIAVNNLQVNSEIRVIQNGLTTMSVTSDGVLTSYSIFGTALVQTPNLRLENSVELLQESGIAGDLVYADSTALGGEGFYGYLESIGEWVKLSPGVSGLGPIGSAFTGIANSQGAVQFGAQSATDTIRFEGQGGTSVSFDPATKKVIISSSASNPNSFSQISDLLGNTITALSPASSFTLIGQGGTTVSLDQSTNKIFISSQAPPSQSFASIANGDGVSQFTAAANGDAIRFASADSSISIGFDPTTKKVSVGSTGIFTSIQATTVAVSSQLTVGSNITLNSDGSVSLLDITTDSIQTDIVELTDNSAVLSAAGSPGQIVYAGVGAAQGQGYYAWLEGQNGAPAAWFNITTGITVAGNVGTAFTRIRDLNGQNGFDAASSTSTLRFKGLNLTTIAFDSATNTVIIDSPPPVGFSQINDINGLPQITANFAESGLAIVGDGQTSVLYNNDTKKVTISTPQQRPGFSKIANSFGVVGIQADLVEDTIRVAGSGGIIISLDQLTKTLTIDGSGIQGTGGSNTSTYFLVESEGSAVATTDPQSGQILMTRLNFASGPVNQPLPVQVSTDAGTGRVTISIRDAVSSQQSGGVSVIGGEPLTWKWGGYAGPSDDPGSGYLKFAPTSAGFVPAQWTYLNISQTDALAANVTAWLNSASDNYPNAIAYLKISKVSQPAQFFLVGVSQVLTATGFWRLKLAATPVISYTATEPSADEIVRVTWARVISQIFTIALAASANTTLTLLVKASEIIGITINGISINEIENWEHRKGNEIYIKDIPYELVTSDTIEVRYKPI